MAKLRDLGKDEDADCVKAWLRSQYADRIRERKAGAKPEDFDKQGTEFHRWVRENRERIGLDSGADFTAFVTRDLCFYARAYALARKTADNYTENFTSVFSTPKTASPCNTRLCWLRSNLTMTRRRSTER